MKINIYIIEKKSQDKLYQPLIEHFKKISKNYAKIEVIQLFDKSLQKISEPERAKEIYSRLFEKHLQRGFSIALDPSSKEVDSFEFAKLLKDKSEVNFFIGGAYGFEKKFIDKSNKTISFGKITLSHKLVKVILMEQIFRGLSINNNHPYHK
jgi:23S rRNA (pseudouridine1915-N3)-methyltransferase